jgi:hypothetical protein
MTNDEIRSRILKIEVEILHLTQEKRELKYQLSNLKKEKLTVQVGGETVDLVVTSELRKKLLS